MASVDDCHAALSTLAARLEDLPGEVRGQHSAERTVSLRVSDLDVTFHARLMDGVLRDIALGEEPSRAQVRLRCTSEDLLALVDGRLGPAGAWATGRLRVEASPLDLLRLRALF